MCITMLLGLSSDLNSLVQESAVHALGIYVMFPNQRCDVSFVADVANAMIANIDHESVSVRTNAAWALANITDAMVLNL